MSEQVESLAGSVAEFERTISRRNAREIVATTSVALVFGLYAGWADRTAETIAALAVGGAALFVGVFIQWVGQVRDIAGKEGAELRRAFKIELQRHARLLVLVPLWYAGPLVVAGAAYAAIKGGGSLGVFFWLGIGAVVVWLNRRAAADLRDRARKVDALPA